MFFSNVCPDLYIFSSLVSEFVFIFFQILIRKTIKFNFKFFNLNSKLLHILFLLLFTISILIINLML